MQSVEVDVISVSSASSVEKDSVSQHHVYISIDVGTKNLCYSVAVYSHATNTFIVESCALVDVGTKMSDIDNNIHELVQVLSQTYKAYLPHITAVIERQIVFLACGSRYSLASSRNSRVEGCLHSAFNSIGINTHSFRLPIEKGISYYRRKKLSVAKLMGMINSETYGGLIAESVKMFFNFSKKKDDISDSIRMLILWIEEKVIGQ
jgi:hypothetical protein